MQSVCAYSISQFESGEQKIAPPPVLTTEIGTSLVSCDRVVSELIELTRVVMI